MSEDYLHKLEDIYSRAVKIPQTKQLEFIKKECDGNIDLYEELRSMLFGGNETVDVDSALKGNSIISRIGSLPESNQVQSADPFLNKRIEHYLITKKIGAGGMGSVYKAVDNKLQRTIAIKFLMNQNQTHDLHERFLREARSAASLNHPHIVTIYEIGEFENQSYIAMEYIDGKPLDDFIQNVNYTIEDVVRIIIQVCDGLKSAHDRNLIHRDIKPQNILLTKNNQVRILDFGLAKLVDDDNLTQAGLRLGTVNYMSPEQGQGLDVDNRSDIFSTGILLYELLTKVNPFRKSSIPATIYSIVQDEPLPLVHYNPSIPEKLQEALNKSLKKSVDERYQDIGEFKKDLEELFNLSSISRVEAPVVTSNEKTLAIMYLRNLGDQKDEFITYGITEDLIINMSRVNSIRTIPMRTIVKYKDSDDELNDIAVKVGADIILDGSIHRFEDSISVSIQLLDVSTGKYLWADRWQEEVGNLPKIKTALTKCICDALDINVETVDNTNFLEAPSEDADAYEKYLQGKFTLEHRKDKADIVIAKNLYESALKLDPSLILAKVGIAEIMIINTSYDDAKSLLNEILTELKSSSSTSEKVRVLTLLSEVYLKSSDNENAIQYAEEAVSLAKQKNDLSGEATALGLLISIYQKKTDYSQIFNYFERVLEINHQLKDTEKIGEALKNMGITYARKGDYEQALNLYHEALSFAEKQENLTLQAACYSNIGNIHFFQNNLSDAKSKYQEALLISEKIGDKAVSARQKLNLGLVILRNSQYDDGIKLLNEAAEDFKNLGDKNNYAIALTNISQANLHENEIEASIKASTEALEIAQSMNHPIPETNSLMQIGFANFYIKKYEDALEVLTEALEIAEDNDLPRYTSQLNLILSRVYLKLADYKKSQRTAKAALATAKELNDNFISSYASAIIGYITIIEGRYNTGIKQIQDARANLKKDGGVEQDIEFQVLYAVALARYSKDEKEKLNGVLILKDLLRLSEEIKYKLMVKIINEHLQDLM